MVVWESVGRVVYCFSYLMFSCCEVIYRGIGRRINGEVGRVFIIKINSEKVRR